eukprot:m.333299 g.333299  ORF g.333299 m.333299 type:complete len:260 (+) comp17112_c0_seq1:65-844(+)
MFRTAFWEGGPRPDGVVQPHDVMPHAQMDGPYTRTQYPTVAGTSILGIKFDGGVVMAADTLGSYGSLAKYRNMNRLKAFGNTTIVGGSGDLADFQTISDMLETLEVDNDEWMDGIQVQPKSVFTYMTRVMYNRRSKMNPLWNTVIVGGMNQGEPFLGYVDKVGVAYTEDTVASGYGAHIALPIMRAAYEQNSKMTEEQARNLMVRCLTVMFYRDARTIDKYQIAVATKDGIKISEPATLVTNWDSAATVDGLDLKMGAN